MFHYAWISWPTSAVKCTRLGWCFRMLFLPLILVSSFYCGSLISLFNSCSLSRFRLQCILKDLRLKYSTGFCTAVTEIYTQFKSWLQLQLQVSWSTHSVALTRFWWRCWWAFQQDSTSAASQPATEKLENVCFSRKITEGLSPRCWWAFEKLLSQVWLAIRRDQHRGTPMITSWQRAIAEQYSFACEIKADSR